MNSPLPACPRPAGKLVEKDSLAPSWHPFSGLLNTWNPFLSSFHTASVCELRLTIRYLSNDLNLNPQVRSLIQSLLTESRADSLPMEHRLVLIGCAWELQKVLWFL
jgi:hypothetical protein